MDRTRTETPILTRRWRTAPLLVVLAAVVLAACGGSEEAGSDEPSVVNVTVTDSAAGQSVESDLSTFTAGVPYHFVVQNTGVLAHELMVVEPIEPNTMSMEEMDEIALFVIEEDDLEAGSTYEVDYTFPADAAGTPLEFACHISGHYESGMHSIINVDA